VSFFASWSKAVYVSAQVPVCCVASCDDGDIPLLGTFGDGVRCENLDDEGAGEGFADEDPATPGWGEVV
jgi:hypothetical protein